MNVDITEFMKYLKQISSVTLGFSCVKRLQAFGKNMYT